MRKITYMLCRTFVGITEFIVYGGILTLVAAFFVIMSPCVLLQRARKFLDEYDKSRN